jgi:hypothetical protein
MSITYEQIKTANKQIVTTPIIRKNKKTGKEETKNYSPVNGRVDAFRSLYPQGFITTDIVSMDKGIVFMKASCGYYENGQAIVLGTGLAYEKETSSSINQTSYIENCETSAVGRALGMAGFGIDTSMASAEEMDNAFKAQDAIDNDINPQRRTELIEEINRLMKDFGQDEKRTIFSQARTEAGIELKEDGTPKTSGAMKVSELERVKTCVIDVIGRLK